MGIHDKQLVLPHATRLDEIFERWVPWEYGTPKPDWAVAEVCRGPSIGKALMGERLPNGKPNIEGVMSFGTFCSVNGIELPEDALGLQVKAHPTVLQGVANRTIIVDGDMMGWEIIKWNDEQALVTCSHSTILGSVWVAIIKPPAFVGNKEMP